MMAGAQWMSHKGKRILLIDFSASGINEIRNTIALAKPLIVKEPPTSILCLVDTTGSKFDLQISKAMQEFSAHNTPYMKMTALVGVEGLQKVIYFGVLTFTKRTNIEMKNGHAEALDWLNSIA